MIMKLYLTSIILVVLFLIYKCSPSTNSSNIYIDLDANRQISISDIFSKINIIPLETTEECLIGNINKLIKHDSTYYLLD